ncbi:anhydro-N-acetylmuramic acid kinase [Parvicella tangerina]|uniref:Anhydro-N-acetylmuramic acid kinase n=1 Tax=Parvicella tangerina TaxID=2829795 RepID=A0A916JMK4_9FLAO|nr:anhydro-N-acetylmuramic acid kinase [Parvicella tangerina]CAG5081889.1 Anhydro-N-acetylmuramic acid kinase [Parvicella tangerina]
MTLPRKRYRIIGLMSGTSLDGLDIALCEFEKDDKWSFGILFAETQKYSDQWVSRLQLADQLSGQGLMQLDADLGKHFGEAVNNFLKKHDLKPNRIDAIASHGQTIFHQPTNSFTTQIGSGAHLSAVTGIKTICDFRSKDVALGGQGAPLVPIGDELLFGMYDYCINFGGIANISFRENDTRKSFDIGFANMASNYLVETLGKPYDENGTIAQGGSFDQSLFEQLNALEYFHKDPPKSLGKEYFDQVFSFTLKNNPLPTQDQLHTFGKHLAFQVAKHLKSGSCLSTGGGSYNQFWLDEIRSSSSVEIIVPEPIIIDFKEALIFAFLGVLRLEECTNTLHSVTGAIKDSIGGCIYT